MDRKYGSIKGNFEGNFEEKARQFCAPCCNAAVCKYRLGMEASILNYLGHKPIRQRSSVGYEEVIGVGLSFDVFPACEFRQV